jgi:hypothetical protein
MKVHPRDNDLVIATHARGFYILDDVTPLQQMATSRPAGVTLFVPTPAVRYIPASDTSVLGNRVWVARNQPYGALISYVLPRSAQAVDFSILDAAGRTVQTFRGPAAAGVNRAVWNLSEVSACASDTAQGGRGGRGGRPGGSWVRAIPGRYTVRLTAMGQTIDQPLIVRLDPRLRATPEDMHVWHREAQTIERTECTLDRASTELASIERQLTEHGARATDASVRDDIDAVRRELRPVALALRGDPKDLGHVNLPGRINWLTIQVGNYSGRPTAAQMEWIATYAAQAAQAIDALEKVKQGSLARLMATRP